MTDQQIAQFVMESNSIEGFSKCIRLKEIDGWVMPSELKPYVPPIEVIMDK